MAIRTGLSAKYLSQEKQSAQIDPNTRIYKSLHNRFFGNTVVDNLLEYTMHFVALILWQVPYIYVMWPMN